MTKRSFLIVIVIMAMSFKAQTAKSQNYVVINGVKWSKQNAGANTPSDYGTLHTYQEALSVCPKGWRLPTKTELNILVESGGTWTTQKGINGRLFGTVPNQVFFPAADSSRFFKRRPIGSYWSDAIYGKGLTYILSFDDDGAHISMANNSNTYTVRCVSNEPQVPHIVALEFLNNLVASNTDGAKSHKSVKFDEKTWQGIVKWCSTYDLEEQAVLPNYRLTLIQPDVFGEGGAVFKVVKTTNEGTRQTLELSYTNKSPEYGLLSNGFCTVVLIRERGLWKVMSFNIIEAYEY